MTTATVRLVDLANVAGLLTIGTPVKWHYRSAIGHGYITGIASRGTSHATTRYNVRQVDHHVSATGSHEHTIVIHTGAALIVCTRAEVENAAHAANAARPTGASLSVQAGASDIDLVGKDGSTWRHGYIPTNPTAVAMKLHRYKGGSSTMDGYKGHSPYAKAAHAAEAAAPSTSGPSHTESTEKRLGRMVAEGKISRAAAQHILNATGTRDTGATGSLKSRALAAGGKLWEKKGMSRVYLNRAEIDKLVPDLTWQEKDFLHNSKVHVDETGIHVKRARSGPVGSGSGDEASALAKLKTALEAHHGASAEELQAAKDVAAAAPTTRERRMARAAKLEGWSSGNAARSDALAAQSAKKADAIPFGQPILTDHYSAGRDIRYRQGIHNDMRRAVEADNKATEQARRAVSIRSATAGSIFDDDPDAIPRLEAKLQSLVAQRKAINDYNASARKALKADPASKHGDLSLLHPKHREDVVAMARAGQIRAGGILPSYLTQNLGGNISRAAARLERLKRQRSK